MKKFLMACVPMLLVLNSASLLLYMSSPDTPESTAQSESTELKTVMPDTDLESEVADGGSYRCYNLEYQIVSEGITHTCVHSGKEVMQSEH